MNIRATSRCCRKFDDGFISYFICTRAFYFTYILPHFRHLGVNKKTLRSQFCVTRKKRREGGELPTRAAFARRGVTRKALSLHAAVPEEKEPVTSGMRTTSALQHVC